MINLSCDKEFQSLDLYLLNPKTQIVEILRTACFKHKIVR